jgi:hypothetical protein
MCVDILVGVVLAGCAVLSVLGVELVSTCSCLIPFPLSCCPLGSV